MPPRKPRSPSLRRATSPSFVATVRDGTVASFNRDTFVHGYTMRVVPFEEQHKIDCDNDVMGRTRGWLELEHLEEDERQVRHVLCLSLFLSLSLFVFKP